MTARSRPASTTGSSASSLAARPGTAGSAGVRRPGRSLLAIAALVRRADPGLRATRRGGGGGGGAAARRASPPAATAKDDRRRATIARPATLAGLHASVPGGRGRSRSDGGTARGRADGGEAGEFDERMRSSPPRRGRSDDGEDDRADVDDRASPACCGRGHRRCSCATATRCDERRSVDGRLTQAARPAWATGCGASGTGAKEALRQATYWQMKNRAGVVGKQGLGPAARAAARRSPGTCVSTSSVTASAPGWSRSRSPACRPASIRLRSSR